MEVKKEITILRGAHIERLRIKPKEYVYVLKEDLKEKDDKKKISD